MRKIDFYGAALLGAAIRTLFPKASYLGSSVDSRGFSASFSDDGAFQEGYLGMLEETMGKLRKEPLQIMEMLGKNAIEMLKYYKQPSPHSLPKITFVLKIGSLFEVSGGEPQQAEDISLLSFSQEGRRVTVHGKAFENKQERQRFEKRYRKWVSHRKIAKDLELYGESTWHPRGMLLRRHLLDFQRKYFQSLGFLEIAAPDPVDYAKKHQLNRVEARGVYYLFGENALKTSLQIMEKWVAFFSFKSQWVLGAKRLKKEEQKTLEGSGISYEVELDSSHSFFELEVIDFLGSRQSGPRLEKVGSGFSFSPMADLDGWITLLLEKERGKLPDWLVPEQVRLLTEKGVDFSDVTKMFRIANIRYTVDQGEGPLQEKVYRALRVNVPYVIIFGNHEEKANQMMIRTSSSQKSETISLTQLQPFLLELQSESQ